MVFWFLGSAAIGFLYDVSIQAAVVFCVATGRGVAAVFLRGEKEGCGVRLPGQGGAHLTTPPPPFCGLAIDLAGVGLGDGESTTCAGFHVFESGSIGRRLSLLHRRPGL
jgi:hypothetical protein